MRDYEVTVILKPDLEDADRENLVERLEEWLTHGSEKKDKPVAEHWGQRTLAYPIKNFREGYYILFNAQLDPLRISETERNITYVDDILRHLFVRKVS